MAKWGAGDILTYASTVSLGLLALWQNKKINDENEKAQMRLQSLSQKANELSIVNKIIEIELNSFNRLKTAFDVFSTACDPQQITSTLIESAQPDKVTQLDVLEILLSDKMSMAEKQLDDAFYALLRELRPDLISASIDPLVNYYETAKKLLSETHNHPLDKPASTLDELYDRRDEFVLWREPFLLERQRLIDVIIYGDLSLDEIKKMLQNYDMTSN